jgi:hypothetical protein
MSKTSNNTLSPTKVGENYNLSARKINAILCEIGFIEKNENGWNITNLGTKNGGVQKQNIKNSNPYVEWHESIFQCQEFCSYIEGKETDIELSNMRDKFPATHRTTDGHYVRSKAEMIIDNWLYNSNIVHAYEKLLPIKEELYCDFYIPKGDVYIEFWGLENNPNYDNRKNTKIDIYKKYNLNLIELTDEEIYKLDDILPKLLLKYGVTII